MFIFKPNKSIPIKPLIRKMLMGVFWLGGMVNAQEIYDAAHSISISNGAEIHVASSPLTTSSNEKKRTKNHYNLKLNTKISNNSKKTINKKYEEPAREKINFRYTNEDRTQFSAHRQNYTYGILVSGFYKVKNLFRDTGCYSLATVLSKEDFEKHNYIYAESYRRYEIPDLNSCRPPPLFMPVIS